MFGTDNRFHIDDVLKRWEHIKFQAEASGITALGFSSDGDIRLLKAMRLGSEIPPTVKIF